MEWLNYHHLFYFWTVAREGTITGACRILSLAQPTISAQIKALEDQLDEKLFERSGRNLVLTEAGQMVYKYADEIFSLGHEMLDTLKGQPAGKPMRLKVGIADVVPKLIVYHLLEPALKMEEPVHLVCFEGKPNELTARLSIHDLDVILSDSPVGPDVSVRAYSHLLGQCNVTVMATEALARKYRENFPDSLNGAPMLFSTQKTTLRKSLEFWFQSRNISPMVQAEFDDSALQEVFGRAGFGLIPVPSVIAQDIQRKYGVHYVGRIPQVKERFYAISLERRIKHPAVAAILEGAREGFFK